MPFFHPTSAGRRRTLIAAAILAAPALVFVAPAAAQSAGKTGSAGETPKQPTADDPSVGLPEAPASTSKNPVAMSPDAGRTEGAAPSAGDGRK